MPVIKDNENFATSGNKLNLIQILNTVAFLLKKISGESSWKTPATISLADLAQRQGTPGLKGDKGDTGVQGVQGIQGLKGDKGDTGAAGATGAKGDKGDPGAVGATGAKGDKGDIGATGAQGIQGLKGDKGDTGAPGGDASVTPQAWQDLTLAANWVNNGGNFSTAQCRKIVGNLIEVKGTIRKSTALVAGEIVATLPTGYAPTKDSYFITWNNNGICRIQLGSDGTIKASATTSNALIALTFMFGLG